MYVILYVTYRCMGKELGKLRTCACWYFLGCETLRCLQKTGNAIFVHETNFPFQRYRQNGIPNSDREVQVSHIDQQWGLRPKTTKPWGFINLVYFKPHSKTCMFNACQYCLILFNATWCTGDIGTTGYAHRRTRGFHERFSKQERLWIKWFRTKVKWL